MGQCICGAWNTMVEEKVIDIKEYKEVKEKVQKKKIEIE